MAAAHQQLPVSKLTCGFCGFISPHFNADPRNIWAPYYRAVYAIGRPDAPSFIPTVRLRPARFPRLSGVGRYRHDQQENHVPARAHERWDDEDSDDHPDGHPGPGSRTSPEQIRIRDIKPPGPELPWLEQVDFAWGFLFHEACWAVLEQALKPDAVDIDVLWRILCSVPCGSELPNWGHNYGGLYMGTMRDQSRGEHFVLLGRDSNLVIPSTFSNPFRVPELERLVSRMRIGEQNGVGGTTDVVVVDQSTGGGIAAVGISGDAGEDPFSVLPLELKEILLCYMPSADGVNSRLASRAMASTPLTQHFFQSRFWAGREMAVFFDAFLLPESEMRGTDWQRLYWQLKIRLKYNRVGLGERNRLRLWNSTISPLAAAMAQVGRMGKLEGAPEWRWSAGASGLDRDWRISRTAKLQAPLAFGETGRVVYRAEAELPPGQMSGVYVSFVDFFGSRYITGLRFAFDQADDVLIGYILTRSEEFLPVYDSLSGFHCATDECGFRALALVTGGDMAMEYLVWAGRPEALRVSPLYSAANDGLSKIRASFDVSGLSNDVRQVRANTCLGVSTTGTADSREVVW